MNCLGELDAAALGDGAALCAPAGLEALAELDALDAGTAALCDALGDGAVEDAVFGESDVVEAVSAL